MLSARAETTKLWKLAEESSKKVELPRSALMEYQENMMSFQRVMALMKSAMQANGVFSDDLETQGTITNIL